MGSYNPPHLGSVSSRCLALIPFVTAQVHRLVDIVSFGPLHIVVSRRYISLLASRLSVRERISHPCKECFVSLSNRCGILHYVSSSASQLSVGRSFHTLIRNVSFHSLIDMGSHNQSHCKSQSPPLAYIVYFGSLRIIISLIVLKHVY